MNEKAQFVRNNIVGSSSLMELITAKRLLENSRNYLPEDQYQELKNDYLFTLKRRGIRPEYLEECELRETEFC